MRKKRSQENNKEIQNSRRKQKLIRICKLLEKHYGREKPVVSRGSRFQTLVATVLSARTKDVNTAKACKLLFSKYPTAKALAKATPKQVEPLIKSTGMYKTKARNIIELAKRVEKRVPKTFEELIKLPGVGRKTANCTLVYAFCIPAICVDTHVHRISNLFGWVKTKTPEQTERALKKLLPKKYWCSINDWLVKHGQKICIANRPKCGECFLRKLCDYGSKHA